MRGVVHPNACPEYPMHDFFSSNLAQFVWGFAAFVVFVLIVLKLGVKQVLAAVDARDEKIKRELAETEAAYARAKQLQGELDQRMREAEGKIAEFMAESRRDADVLKAKAVEAGRIELDAMRTRALAEIEAARQSAIVHLRAEISDIATLVAEKILRTQLDAKKHEDLVAQAIETFEAGAKVKV
jgi:F-type H+-transporting ATPase subunit b